jgi:hypothetical protein
MTIPILVPVYPDIELMLMYVLVPLNPDIRFVTIMPAGDLPLITTRVHRTSGANRNIAVDRPIVDVDVFGFSTDVNAASEAARTIQAQILSLMGIALANGSGVIQHATTVIGPRQLPEANPALVRYSASYEILVHS